MCHHHLVIHATRDDVMIVFSIARRRHNTQSGTKPGTPRRVDHPSRLRRRRRRLGLAKSTTIISLHTSARHTDAPTFSQHIAALQLYYSHKQPARCLTQRITAGCSTTHDEHTNTTTPKHTQSASEFVDAHPTSNTIHIVQHRNNEQRHTLGLRAKYVYTSTTS